MSTDRLLAVTQGMDDVVSTTWGQPEFALSKYAVWVYSGSVLPP